MKNKIIILLTLLLFVSCSNLRTNEIKTEKQYEILLNDWELNKLSLLLDDSKNSTNSEIVKKYRILLDERIKAKEDLEKMINDLKTQLESNNFENIDMYFNDSFVNRKIISELVKIDFSQMKIMVSKPKFHKDTAVNTVAVIFRDQVEYFQFNYKLSNKKWSIMGVKDGR
ncbi:hypothetical protein [Fusobacterium sp.]|uniref:hypothetical protein n=1 Tax=Fusobacterium sp. TaxID=68766 RepID=UPI002611B899|nr:hypothetical protein [Fusobacterium sp.]